MQLIYDANQIKFHRPLGIDATGKKGRKGKRGDDGILLQRLNGLMQTKMTTNERYSAANATCQISLHYIFILSL